MTNWFSIVSSHFNNLFECYLFVKLVLLCLFSPSFLSLPSFPFFHPLLHWVTCFSAVTDCLYLRELRLVRCFEVNERTIRELMTSRPIRLTTISFLNTQITPRAVSLLSSRNFSSILLLHNHNHMQVHLYDL